MIARRARHVILLLLVTACGTSAYQKGLQVSVTSLNAARDGFTAYNDRHQQQLVERATTVEAGEAALKQWRSQREPILDALLDAYSALALAAVDELSLADAVKAIALVNHLIKELSP